MNQGTNQVLDHVKTEMEAAEEDIRDAFATGIYSAGTDAKEIDGARIFLSASNTYGGIAQSTNSWWQAKVDSTTTALSLAAMQSRYEAASEPPDRPNLITTTETLFNSFHALLTPIQRFADKSTADAGYQNLLFRGAPVLEDSYCPASHMVFWNLKHIKFVSHASRKFPGEQIPFQSPVNQDVLVSHIRWMGNLVCSQPRKQGVMTALTS